MVPLEYAEGIYKGIKADPKKKAVLAVATPFIEALRKLSDDDRKAYDDAITDLITKTAGW